MPKQQKQVVTPEQMAARNAIRRINRAIKCIVAAKDTEKLRVAAQAINEALVKLENN